jgi:hypothetical protein
MSEHADVGVRTREETPGMVSFYLIPEGAPADFQGRLLAIVPAALMVSDPQEIRLGEADKPKIYVDLCSIFLALANRIGAEFLGNDVDPKPRLATARKPSLRGLNGGRS